MRSVDIHKIRAHAPTFDCNECEKKFTKVETLNNHKNKSHKVGFKCDICEFMAVNKKFLNLHKEAKHSTIPLVKGMGMKRDASIKTNKPDKRAKIHTSPNKVEEKEEGCDESSALVE